MKGLGIEMGSDQAETLLISQIAELPIPVDEVTGYPGHLVSGANYLVPLPFEVSIAAGMVSVKPQGGFVVDAQNPTPVFFESVARAELSQALDVAMNCFPCPITLSHKDVRSKDLYLWSQKLAAFIEEFPIGRSPVWFVLTTTRAVEVSEVGGEILNAEGFDTRIKRG